MAARQTLPILCNNLDRVVAITVNRDPLDFNSPGGKRARFSIMATQPRSDT